MKFVWTGLAKVAVCVGDFGELLGDHRFKKEKKGFYYQVFEIGSDIVVRTYHQHPLSKARKGNVFIQAFSTNPILARASLEALVQDSGLEFRKDPRASENAKITAEYFGKKYSKTLVGGN